MSNEIENAVWDKITIARHPKRPTALTVIPFIVDDFLELHGDRLFSDDPSFITGLGFFNGIPVTVIAQEKGIATQDKIDRNFGMAHPEGFRKALRMMQQAEKFNRPILIFIDTPGAYPGIGAEERGQARAIADNLFQMVGIKTPIIAVVLSVGGSGGALAIGVSDRLYMLENSIFSIISPEGFASILFKDSSLAKKAAGLMKLTASDLLTFGMIDSVIPEVNGGFHEDVDFTIRKLKAQLAKDLKKLLVISKESLIQTRYAKFRQFGLYEEKKVTQSK